MNFRGRSGTQRRVQTSVIRRDGPVFRYQLDYDMPNGWGTLPVVDYPGKKRAYVRGRWKDYYHG